MPQHKRKKKYKQKKQAPQPKKKKIWQENCKRPTLIFEICFVQTRKPHRNKRK